MSLHPHRFLNSLCVALAALAGLMATQPVHATTRPTQIIISAVLPNPKHGPEWVMIENHIAGSGNKPFKTFLPLVATDNAGAKPIGGIGQPPALNIADIAGWRLGNGNTWYTIPHDLPPMPAGAKVIVYFDGKGAPADDYEYDDGAAELHTPAGMVNLLPDTQGVIFLYAGDVNTPDNLRARYEWGVGIESFGDGEMG